MPASEACCTRPAAKANYSPQGEWVEIDGLKTCMQPLTSKTNPSILINGVDRTGSSAASKAIVVIYDVFGLAPQTLQVRSNDSIVFIRRLRILRAQIFLPKSVAMPQTLKCLFLTTSKGSMHRVRGLLLARPRRSSRRRRNTSQMLEILFMPLRERPS